jgi:hypothetical protein
MIQFENTGNFGGRAVLENVWDMIELALSCKMMGFNMFEDPERAAKLVGLMERGKLEYPYVMREKETNYVLDYDGNSFLAQMWEDLKVGWTAPEFNRYGHAEDKGTTVPRSNHFDLLAQAVVKNFEAYELSPADDVINGPHIYVTTGKRRIAVHAKDDIWAYLFFRELYNMYGAGGKGDVQDCETVSEFLGR